MGFERACLDMLADYSLVLTAFEASVLVMVVALGAMSITCTVALSLGDLIREMKSERLRTQDAGAEARAATKHAMDAMAGADRAADRSGVATTAAHVAATIAREAAAGSIRFDQQIKGNRR